MTGARRRSNRFVRHPLYRAFGPWRAERMREVMLDVHALSEMLAALWARPPMIRDGGQAPYSRWLLGRCSGTVLPVPLRAWLATRLARTKISTLDAVTRRSSC